ncbi:anti-sigma factor [Pseudactinotalea suaedae]|uniref:anti-sigma factor n=1 Tax=Pseudactinotalea suaedae TaxID=1524924 RepID=UPI0012E0E4E9|nr:anti-sigma factor [Pseudactinotalea suaedae]
MSHCDPDVLALAALGEELPAADADHLAACATCAAEVASLRAVVDAGRVRGPLERPHDRVWEAIAAEIASETPAAPVSGPTTPDPTAPAPEPAAEPAAATVVPLRAPRPRSRRLVLVAAASIAFGAVATVGLQALLADREETTPVASAVLDPLPGWDVAGTAVVDEGPQGLRLRVEVPDDPGVDGYREVWLISTDLERLISVGVLTSDTGTFDLPAGVDLADFAVVDISEEPVDGDPAHSGVSIVRGELA